MAEVWNVYKTNLVSDPWCAYNEFSRDEIIEYFPTHAEAVAYADSMARTNQGENK